MDIQNNQARRAKQDQMDIQYLQTRRSRQIAQRQARQKRQQNIKQQIEKRINTNFTSQNDIQVGELLRELGKTGSPQYQQYADAAYFWKSEYLRDKMKKIIAEPWNAKKGKQVDRLMFQLESLMTKEDYQKDLEVVRLWEVRSQIETIISSDFTSEKNTQVVQLLEELGPLVTQDDYQQYADAAFNWKINYLEGEINKIIVDSWTTQKGQKALKLLNQLRPLNQNIYQEDLEVIRSWEARHYEDEIKKIMENRFNTSRYSRVTEILDILESQYPERYENVLKWTYRWRTYYYIEEIKKIINNYRYTYDREQEALGFLERLERVGKRTEYEFWRERIFDWKHGL